MQPRYAKFNPKRKLASSATADAAHLASLAERVRYGGNPEHKRNPGDFGLTPPADPRVGKSLCDAAGIFGRDQATELLRQGLRRGLVSERRDGDWPTNVWSVTADGKPLEAQLENRETGAYHGYPMPDTDPMHAEILERWSAAVA